ncbi:MAG: fused MFS/spermidine synthase [Phycisphaerales bacterium]
MLALFTGAILASAFLLFLVQPMAAKIVLPKLGGAPSVWIGSMLFFQAALLAGYGYTHVLTSKLRVHVQVLIHGVLLIAAGLTLPPPTDLQPPAAGDDPVFWLLRTLAITVGLPFLVVATTSPLVQRWFSYTSHKDAKDPYFLYGVGNVGNILGLLAYPLLLEPLAGLRKQTHVWSIGFVVMVVLVLGAGVVAIRSAKATGSDEKALENTATEKSVSISWRQRLWWVLLAFVPSSLLLGVTLHITTDIGTLPLLWAIPLVLYLLSFVVAFSSRVRLAGATLAKIVIMLLVVVAASMLWASESHPWINIALHCGVFFVCAWLCHKLLSDARPNASGLTEFYLWLSVGGMLGGIVNSLLAPRVFNSVLEYPLVLGLVGVVAAEAIVRQRNGVKTKNQPATSQERKIRTKSLAWSWVIAIVLVIAMFVALVNLDEYFNNHAKQYSPQTLAAIRVVGPIGVFVLLAAILGVRRTAPVLAVILISTQLLQGRAQSLHRERTFFGVHDVIQTPNGAWHELRHGTTSHGLQKWLPEQDRLLPRGYYDPRGPAGDVFRAMANAGKLKNVGIMGMGAAGLAAYGVPGATFVFYEIDPAVIAIAGEPKFFTYVSKSRATTGYVEGDGRMKIAESPESSFDLIVLDVFSSDSIPTHLVTLEAIRDVYVPRLKPGGVLLMHISNRYFDLSGPLARIAQETELKVLMRADNDVPIEQQYSDARKASTWMVMAKEVADFRGLEAQPGWIPVRARENQVLWTDDYTNLLGALKR